MILTYWYTLSVNTFIHYNVSPWDLNKIKLSTTLTVSPKTYFTDHIWKDKGQYD